MTPMNIEIVGLISDTNDHSCYIHPCCGRALVQDAPDKAEGKVFCLCLVSRTNLALSNYNLTQYGGNGCRIGFARRIYAVTCGQELDGRLVEVYRMRTMKTSPNAATFTRIPALPLRWFCFG